ncbi:MAG: sigma-70 family RNA polymerase sigma factor [Deltaproteobacteria bacterium]|nr:MAG: sigma-70 family RNA polymerase sigma factor [Deltaproteobacteria bacterium]
MTGSVTDGLALRTNKQQEESGGPGRLGELMKAAQAGDEVAYRELLDEIQPLLLRYVRRRVSSAESAEDIVQDALLTMHRVRHTYEPERPFEPWMYAIARSRVIDFLRKQRRISTLEVLFDTLPEVADAAAEITVEQAREVFEALPAAQREAFAMLKLEGLSTEEAAERAGVSVSALKVRAHRAYNTIKKAFSGD